jgi:carbonic anhydrase
MALLQQTRCGCSWLSTADLIGQVSARRSFLRLLAGIGVTAAFDPVRLWAQKPTYEAMLLSCIDPRFVDPVHSYMTARGLDGKYSQFTIAGAAIATEAKAFAAWRPAFWDNLATSIDLHKIKRVIAIDHRDCGAARIAYGAESIANSLAETELHKRVLLAFRQDVGRRHPRLEVETGLMALDGSIEMFT